MEYTGYPISRNEYSNMLDNANDVIFDLRHEIDELIEIASTLSELEATSLS